ncbi:MULTISPECIES: hypothetical protein [unclassified Streptomyces]|uniref:hypothetical protein n=1 Tax=unclassified Streptomyces TaxID=2593676 RepID=UPI0022562B0E|nr:MULTISPECIES: hypothetical protein [unclassified Streptomyces]MCX5055848.1 hypothetical protein [Streptomyces sp. NBC_00452]MCX5286942.1 hypothetical protein [Streptomyces sp. NBC_00183]
MTRTIGTSALAGAVVAVFLLAACSSGKETQADPTPSAQQDKNGETNQEKDHEKDQEKDRAKDREKELTAQAVAALGAPAAADASFVASGVERVGDGVHADPGLSSGTVYRLSVVCAGTGAADIEFTSMTTAPGHRTPKKPVTCDGTPVRDRFTGKKSLRVDVSGRPGATGMVAWRIDKV